MAEEAEAREEAEMVEETVEVEETAAAKAASWAEAETEEAETEEEETEEAGASEGGGGDGGGDGGGSEGAHVCAHVSDFNEISTRDHPRNFPSLREKERGRSTTQDAMPCVHAKLLTENERKRRIITINAERKNGREKPN